jgi:hypothetical protein
MEGLCGANQACDKAFTQRPFVVKALSEKYLFLLFCSRHDQCDQTALEIHKSPNTVENVVFKKIFV